MLCVCVRVRVRVRACACTYLEPRARARLGSSQFQPLPVSQLSADATQTCNVRSHPQMVRIWAEYVSRTWTEKRRFQTRRSKKIPRAFQGGGRRGPKGSPRRSHERPGPQERLEEGHKKSQEEAQAGPKRRPKRARSLPQNAPKRALGSAPKRRKRLQKDPKAKARQDP